MYKVEMNVVPSFYWGERTLGMLWLFLSEIQGIYLGVSYQIGGSFIT